MDTNRFLALTNASLTFLSLCSMLMGYYEIRRRHVRRHKNFMLLAFTASFCFLVLFILRYVLYGATPYKSESLDVWVFRVIYYTHEPLAVINAPLVLVTLITGLRRRFRMHRELANITLSIWVYVSITGILIALFLYVLQ